MIHASSFPALQIHAAPDRRGGDRSDQVRVIERPPSTSIAVPDWKLDASEAR
jgi:hypothetical protein